MVDVSGLALSLSIECDQWHSWKSGHVRKVSAWLAHSAMPAKGWDFSALEGREVCFVILGRSGCEDTTFIDKDGRFVSIARATTNPKGIAVSDLLVGSRSGRLNIQAFLVSDKRVSAILEQAILLKEEAPAFSLSMSVNYRSAAAGIAGHERVVSAWLSSSGKSVAGREIMFYAQVLHSHDSSFVDASGRPVKVLYVKTNKDGIAAAVFKAGRSSGKVRLAALLASDYNVGCDTEFMLDVK